MDEGPRLRLRMFVPTFRWGEMATMKSQFPV